MQGPNTRWLLHKLDYVQSLKCFVSVSFLLFVRLIIVFKNFDCKVTQYFVYYATLSSKKVKISSKPGDLDDIFVF